MERLPREFWSFIRYFKSYEFSSPDDPDSCNLMDYRFVILLDTLRYLLHEIVKLSSAFRTPEHNRDIGANDDSAHLTGHAVDIVVRSDAYRYRVLFLAINLGINRIGIYPGHIHLDVDPNKTPGVFWYGTDKQTVN